MVVGALAPVAMAQVYTDPVGFVKVDAIAHGMTMVSVPLNAQDKKLNGDPGCLGDMIEEQLVGFESAGEADSIYTWDPATESFTQVFLVEGTGDPNYDNKWFNTDFTQSTLELKAGDVFWVDRRSGHGTQTATITFLGWVPTEDSITVRLYPGLTMFTWPYPTDLAINSSTLGTVAHGAEDPSAADTVYRYDPVAGSFSAAFLVSLPGDPLDGKWCDVSTFEPTDMKFVPGAGFWFLRQRAYPQITWICNRPYTLD